jgi:hypothetical protein
MRPRPANRPAAAAATLPGRAAILFIAFSVAWSLRATVLFGVDEALPPGWVRSAWATAVKLVLWAAPVLAYAFATRGGQALAYLALTTRPSRGWWAAVAAVWAVYLGGFLVLGGGPGA